MSEAADAEGATLLSEIRAISARLAADAEVRERERAELTEIKETIVARVDGLEKVRYTVRLYSHALRMGLWVGVAPSDLHTVVWRQDSAATFDTTAAAQMPTRALTAEA